MPVDRVYLIVVAGERDEACSCLREVNGSRESYLCSLSVVHPPGVVISQNSEVR